MNQEHRFRMAADEEEGHIDRYTLSPRMQRELKQPRRSFVAWVGIICLTVLAIIAYLVFAFIVAVLLVPAARAQEQDKSNCRGFIPEKCCCTANYCRTITEDEVSFDGKDWHATATGLIVKYVLPSQDGSLILCDSNGKGNPYCLLRPAYM